jgi:hypothetical protein
MLKMGSFNATITATFKHTMAFRTHVIFVESLSCVLSCQLYASLIVTARLRQMHHWKMQAYTPYKVNSD